MLVPRPQVISTSAKPWRPLATRLALGLAAVALSATVGAGPAAAQTLTEALASAYTSNPQLLAQRARPQLAHEFVATDQRLRDLHRHRRHVLDADDRLRVGHFAHRPPLDRRVEEQRHLGLQRLRRRLQFVVAGDQASAGGRDAVEDAIGVVGPMPMNYPVLVPLVHAVADAMTASLSRDGRAVNPRPARVGIWKPQRSEGAASGVWKRCTTTWKA